MKDATKLLVLCMMIAALFVGTGLTRVSVVQADEEEMTEPPTNTEVPAPDNSVGAPAEGDMQQ